MKCLSRVLALAAVLIAPAARAQVNQELNFERLRLDPGGRGSLVIGTGEVAPRGSFRVSAAGHWEHLPLSLRGTQILGRISDGQKIVEDRLSIETSLDYVPLQNLEVYGRLPIIVDQQSDFDTVESSGIGTPSFGVRFSPAQQSQGSAVDLALAVELWPTWGSRDVVAKEKAIAAQLRGEIGKTFGSILVGGELGFLNRKTQELGDTTIGTEVEGGVVVALAKGAIRPELSYRGAIPFGGSFASSELLAGVRGMFGPVEAFVLGGPGFGNAYGTPQWRGLLGVAYRYEPARAAPAAAQPAAVVAPPPPDPCSPGQTHTPAQCPNLDDDGDGIANRDDACPTEKGIPEMRGCPAKDSDADGVPDHLDKCPDRAGPADNQGCPLAQITPQKIDISQKVMFDTSKATLKPESDKVLAAVAALMQAHPEVKKVSIEGYTDSSGSAQTNKRLSRQRAEAVRAALVKLGVESSRLEAKGFGPSNPIAPNDTAEGREANRRVEFVIRGVDQPVK